MPFSSALLETKELRRGLAAPERKLLGDITTSLSLPCLAVPVYGSIVIPLLILFGRRTAPDSSITSLNCLFISSSSAFLLSLAIFSAFLDEN